MVEKGEVKDKIDCQEEKHRDGYSEVEALNDDENSDDVGPEKQEEVAYRPHPGVLHDQIFLVVGLHLPDHSFFVVLGKIHIEF